jgi:hypothetical protein
LDHQKVLETGLYKQDDEYNAKLKGYEDEIARLNADLANVGD